MHTESSSFDEHRRMCTALVHKHLHLTSKSTPPFATIKILSEAVSIDQHCHLVYYIYI